MDFEWHLACKLMRIRDLKDRQIAIFVPEEWLHFSYRYYLSIREASAATAASLCAGHAQQLGGESPLPNLMEVKG